MGTHVARASPRKACFCGAPGSQYRRASKVLATKDSVASWTLDYIRSRIVIKRDERIR